ncbi:MAG TPA: hypothetical protein VIL71_09035 [Spirillospora sp.]
MDRPATVPNPGGAARGSAESLSLRPPRRLLTWLVSAAALSIATVVIRYGTWSMLPFIPLLSLAALFLIVLGGVLLRGRTWVDGAGLRNRWFLQTRFIPWSDVDAFLVESALFGRGTVVRLANGKRFHLVAPRSGLLPRNRGFDATLDAMAALSLGHVAVERKKVWKDRISFWSFLVYMLMVQMLFIKPWQEPLWPGRDEATSLPRACTVADLATALKLLPDIVDAYDRDREYPTGDECVYQSHTGANLKVGLSLWKGTSDGATEEARARFTNEVSRFIDWDPPRSLANYFDRESWTHDVQDVRGIGDQASRSVLVNFRDRTVEVRLLVRYANVFIDVTYKVERPGNEVAAAADALARAAVERIDLR